MPATTSPVDFNKAAVAAACGRRGARAHPHSVGRQSPRGPHGPGSQVARRPDPGKEAGRQVLLNQLAELKRRAGETPGMIKVRGLKVVMLFRRGADAGGQGRAIKTISAPLTRASAESWRSAAPTAREKTASGIPALRGRAPAPARWLLFDRSWYNAPAVEHVMGFCTEEEYAEYLRSCPSSSGCSCARHHPDQNPGSRSATPEQEKRFQAAWRTRQALELSPMDVMSRSEMGRILARQRTPCSQPRTFPKPPGGSSPGTIRSAPRLKRLSATC